MSTEMPGVAGERSLLDGVVAAVTAAGDVLRREFDAHPRPAGIEDVFRLMKQNDEQSVGVLRSGLDAARAGVPWAGDELDTGPLPSGEWWVTDPVEGNINKAHGLSEFSVTATLVCDNEPVVTAVHLPLAGTTYTAVAGGGAHQDGAPLTVSAKSGIRGLYLASSQNAGSDTETEMRQLGAAVTELLKHTTVVRVVPPPTLQLVQVAAGRIDGFWQFGAERAGVLSGVLLVREAGGVVTDLAGAPWTTASADILACTPGAHSAVLGVLGRIG